MCKPYLLSSKVVSDAYWVLRTPDSCCGSAAYRLPRTGKENASQPPDFPSYPRGVSLDWAFSALLSRKPSPPPPPFFQLGFLSFSISLCLFLHLILIDSEVVRQLVSMNLYFAEINLFLQACFPLLSSQLNLASPKLNGSGRNQP